MKKQRYLSQLGFACPRTGHWVAAGSTVEMTPSAATQLVLSGYLVAEKPEPASALAKKGK